MNHVVQLRPWGEVLTVKSIWKFCPVLGGVVPRVERDWADFKSSWVACS